MRERLWLRVLALLGVTYGVWRRLAPGGATRPPGLPVLRTAGAPDRPELPRPAPRAAPRPALRWPADRMMQLRVLLGAVGVLGAAYGAVQLLLQHQSTHPVALFVWLAVAVAVHDGVLVPLTLLVGAVLARVVPSRARRYVQGALVAGALVTAFSIPLVYRRGTVPAVKVLEVQDYLGHLGLVLAIIAAGAAVAYAVDVARAHRSPHAVRAAPPATGL